ncbi:MAG: universal stress protein [Burkholderiaceae bacterium]
MTPKSILCPVSHAQADFQLDQVYRLCEAQGAHLTVLLIGINPPMPMAIEAPSAEYWAEAINKLRAQIDDRGRALEKQLHERGLSADVRTVTCDASQVDQVVGQHGRFADLVVSPASLLDDDIVRAPSIAGSLFQAGRPLLLQSPLDPGKPLSLEANTVVVAWDGGLPVSRSLAFAIGLLQAASAVHVVSIDPVMRDDADGEAPGWDLATYLSRHGIKVTVTNLPSGGQDIDAALLRHATEIGADLIVMGAYGHSKLRELIFGGTTRNMLANSPVPLFMAH